MGKNTGRFRMYDSETGELLSSDVWTHEFRTGDKVQTNQRIWRVVSIKDTTKGVMITKDLVLTRVDRPTRKKKPTPPWVPLKLRVLRERHRKEELALVLEALDSANWSAAEAARLIGIDPNTMRSMIRSHKLAKEWRKRRP